MWILNLPWDKPPLSLNDRMHWRVEGQYKAMLRNTARLLAKQQKIPTLGRVRVRLVWTVTDHRRRDEDNPLATMKPLCDGLVDARVVKDDTSHFMVKEMPRIVLGSEKRLRLEIEDITDGDPHAADEMLDIP